MSTLLELPTEVFDFLRRPPPQSMVVRGPPGSGKTTFALALLQNYPGRKIYLTTRVTRADLIRDYPFLGNGSGIQVIDGLGFASDIRRTRASLASADRVVVGEQPREVAELESLWLPEALQDAWSRSSTTEPSLIVVDSWDALIEDYLGPSPGDGNGSHDRSSLERVLIRQISNGPVFLVLVLERSDPTQLDYLVNGVLGTTWEAPGGRPERWLTITKLRGTRVDHPLYPFTLEGGRFQCILPLPPNYAPTPLSRIELEPDHQPGTLWPGSSAFARAFGRLKLGTVSILERDEGVPTSAIRLLLNPMVGSTLSAGDRVVHILPPNILPSEIWEAYRAFVDAEGFVRQVRLQCTASNVDVPDELAKAILPPPATDTTETSPRTPEALKFLRSPGHHKGNLSIVWLTGLEALQLTRGISYSSATLPAIALQYVTGASVHVTFVGVSHDPLLESLRPIASMRLRIRSHAGRIFVHGEEPSTPMFVLSEGDDGSAYRLLRVV